MAGGQMSSDGDVGFQIAPMVDVVFVLLLFFMATIGSQITELELSINLPSGESKGPGGDAVTPIIIDIGPDGSVMLNDTVYDTPTSKELPELREWLTGTMERFGDRDPVIIKPHLDARHERIMDVLSAAAAAGVTNLTFG